MFFIHTHRSTTEENNSNEKKKGNCDVKKYKKKYKSKVGVGDLSAFVLSFREQSL